MIIHDKFVRGSVRDYNSIFDIILHHAFNEGMVFFFFAEKESLIIRLL